VIGDRPISDVLQDILRNLQDIVRSEVRLAKAEIRADATQAAASALWMTAGVVGAISSAMLLIWTVVFALATVLPMWMATLSAAILTACIAGLVIIIGVRKFKRLRPIPERTVQTIKEHVEWMKQSAK
jgi:putative superfamily III holin-X